MWFPPEDESFRSILVMGSCRAICRPHSGHRPKCCSALAATLSTFARAFIRDFQI